MPITLISFQNSGFVRKPSLVAAECINLKNFLGLTRQRSEVNLSNLGLVGNERRSRSEVRGISCDRLTIGYHTPSIEPQCTAGPQNGKSGGWLRGRKKEREVRNPTKNGTEGDGKTVVIGTRRASSKPGDTRTVADQSCGVLLKNVTKLPSEGRQSNRNSVENIVEEDIYMEMGHSKLNDVKVKGPPKPGRKKCQAPKPNIPSIPSKEPNCDVNLNPSGFDSNLTTNCFLEKKMSPMIKPSRKLYTVNGRNDDRNLDNRTVPAVKLNNFKNSETFLTVKNKINSDANTYVTVAEIHKSAVPQCKSDSINKLADIIDNQINMNKNTSCESDQNMEIKNCSNIKVTDEDKMISDENEYEIPSYHIDTPDYSTLESVVDNNKKTCELTPMNILKNKTSSLNDLINCITLNYSSTETEKPLLQGTISSILRDSSNDIELTPKKVVRFEKLDLIETYKKNKAESLKDSDEESIISNSEKKPSTDTELDVNSNEIMPPEEEKIPTTQTNVSEAAISEKISSSSSDCFSESSSSTESECLQKAMTVNLVIRNPSTEINVNGESQNDETQMVVKKSFVLTVAKQEKGFQSLCANKKSDLLSTEPPQKVDKKVADHKISVTFLCSETPPEEIKKNEPTVSVLRLPSISVPPQILQKSDSVPLQPIARGRSRERRCKDRHHHKKNHKSKKKGKFTFLVLLFCII